jgi:hypothetical protein
MESRMHRACWLLSLAVVWSACQLGDASVATAQAQSGSVKAVFEKHNLLATFARDCSQPASPDNWYFVNRLSGASQVQRDYMVGPTERQSVAMIDTAVETARNQITISGRFNGKSGGKSYNNQPMIATWRLQGDRLQIWEASLANQKIIAAGKVRATGRDLPWLNQCNAGAQTLDLPPLAPPPPKEQPAAAGETDLCSKYLPSVGRIVQAPCEP